MTNEQIHGHEVMEMMLCSETPYTKESLEKAIKEKFGEDARFYTCSAEKMTAKELIEFLDKKGKFVEEGEGFTTSKSNMCNHH